MKKLVSLAIAAILVFVLAVPAFALEPETQVIVIPYGIDHRKLSFTRISEKRQYYTRLFLLWRGNRKCSA